MSAKIKTFKYRIYPTRKQTTTLNKQLEECRWLYNHFLAERKETYSQTGKTLNYHAQAVSLPVLKEQRLSLKEVNAQVLQNVAVRVDLAFQAFFRRVKNGETPGYPRFKGFGRYDSLTFPQAESSCEVKNSRLKISKIGHIKIIQHRPLPATPKTATITRTTTSKWFVCFTVEVEPKPLPKLENGVGIDIGLITFATFSDGVTIENPRFFRKGEKELARVQRKLSKAEKGTPERKKRRKVVARVHERIGWKRQDFSHQESRKVVNHYGKIFVEDLHVNRMVHNHCLAKSISDAAWSNFFSMLFCKAEDAGRIITKVNPAFTTQACSSCGHRQKMPLSERIFNCSCCGNQLNRDLNAALNILRVGLHSHGEIPSLEAALL